MLRQLTPAKTLSEIYKTLSQAPLVTKEELEAFYRPELNKARGSKTVQRLENLLRGAYESVPYRVFLMGHLGVGKSTEMSTLIQAIQDQFQVIRLSAKNLDPVGFKVFDVLLLMMMDVAEQTASAEGAGKPPSKKRLEELLQWFATEKNSFTQSTDLEGGLKTKVSSEPWTKLLGIFAELRGEIRYATTRKREVVEYRLSRVSSLIELANKLLDECNDLLRTAKQKEWLFIWEDFDKRIAPEKIEELFITYSSIFVDLNAHAIYSLPIGLGYSDKGKQLPFERISIPDTPIFTADHQVNKAGVEALEVIVSRRIEPKLFENGQLHRLIIASGGSLRDLFAMIIFAASAAEDLITSGDVTSAINQLRLEYRNGLGQSEFDKIDYDQKAKRLVAIYQQEPKSDILNPVLYSLLRSRALLEFNGKGWYGVHPLVVDILADQQEITLRDAEGRVPGGSY